MSVQDEKNYWDTAAQDSDVDNKFISSIDTDACLNAIIPALQQSVKNGYDDILEIGCGVGRLTTRLAIGVFAGTTVYGTDISKKLLKIAEKRTPSKLYNVRYKQCDGRALPYKDGAFTAVYSVLTFQHIPNEAKESYIKEAARVLSQGGVFRFQFVEDAEAGPVSYGISRDEITTMCEYAGFAVEQIDAELIEPNWIWVTAVKS